MSSDVLPETDERCRPLTKPVDATVYDADGRRRVVLTREDRRTIDKAIALLSSIGLGMVVGCRSRTDGKPPCGHPLLMEGIDFSAKPGQPNVSADAGYGCECTRLHYLGAGAHGG